MTLNLIRTNCESPKRLKQLLSAWLLLSCVLPALSISLLVARVRAQAVPEKELIVSVDADALMDAVFPGCRRDADAPRLTRIGVRYEYAMRDSDETIVLSLSVYAETKQAKHTPFRSLPSAEVRGPPGGRETYGASIEGFVSRLACHVRVRNVSAVVRFGKELPLAQRNDVWKSVVSALGDDAIAPRGTVVDIPKLSVVELSKASDGGRTLDGMYNVVCRSVPGLLFAQSGAPAISVSGEAQYEFVIRPDTRQRTTELEFARPTGEVGVYRIVHDELSSITETRPSWQDRESNRLRKQKYGLSDVVRGEIFAKLRKGDRNDAQENRLVSRLRDEGAPDSVLFYLEILDSDLHASVKATALRAFDDAKGKDGLDDYREFASDTSRSSTVRVLSVQLIGRYGMEADKDLLRRIARKDGIRLPSVFASDEQRKQLAQDKFDGIDVLKYELWIAAGALEGRFPSR